MSPPLISPTKGFSSAIALSDTGIVLFLRAPPCLPVVVVVRVRPLFREWSAARVREDSLSGCRGDGDGERTDDGTSEGQGSGEGMTLTDGDVGGTG